MRIIELNYHHQVIERELRPHIMRQAVLMALLCLMLPLSGCFSPEEDSSEQTSNSIYPDIYDRHELQWDWNGSYAMVLESGPYESFDV